MTTPITTVTLNPAIDQTAAVPNFQADAVNRVAWDQADAGGKGINVAAFLAEFGCTVNATGFLGEDNQTLFTQLFYAQGIHDHCIRIPGKTRVNIKIVDDAQGQVTDLNFPGQTVRERDLIQLQQAIFDLSSQSQWFIFSGSVPAGLPPSIYHDLMAPLKAQGKTLVLDTSGDALRHALPAQPDLIKPNRVELEELLGQSLHNETEIVAAARELIHAGIPHIVVSLGADGALFIDAHTAIHAHPPAIAVKSTVGAGDAMVAGTVLGLTQQRPLADCAALATAFSMGALTQIGPRLPPRAEIEANCDRVTLRRVD